MIEFNCTSLRVGARGLFILDQTELPQREVWVESRSFDEMISIIQNLKVRGAPLIGVAAALQLARMVDLGATAKQLEKALWALREARPTAVNLMHAMDRCRHALEDGPAALKVEAERLCLEDVELSKRMAAHGASVIEDNDHVLTHCNTGGLATVGIGTALGAIIQAKRDGKRVHVFVDETRPLLQGGRLTTWELEREKIPHTLICDGMAATLMAQGKIQRVFVGADRIACNGDFANKVGTYGVAVSAAYHDVPFYVVAPQTTVDPSCRDGAEIPVEERAPDEVRGARGAFGEVTWAPNQCAVWNPAFDVTPAKLVTSWVLDRGVFTPGDAAHGKLSNN